MKKQEVSSRPESTILEPEGQSAGTTAELVKQYKWGTQFKTFQDTKSYWYKVAVPVQQRLGSREVDTPL